MPGAYLIYLLAGALFKRTFTVVHNIRLLQTPKLTFISFRAVDVDTTNRGSGRENVE